MKNNLSPEDMVRQVVATLAIEDMYVSEEFKKELLLVAQKKKLVDNLIAELDKKYTKTSD